MSKVGEVHPQRVADGIEPQDSVSQCGESQTSWTSRESCAVRRAALLARQEALKQQEEFVGTEKPKRKKGETVSRLRRRRYVTSGGRVRRETTQKEILLINI